MRCFAAAAAKAQPKESSSSSSNQYLIPAEELKTTNEGGVVVSSQETNRPLSRIAVYFKYNNFFMFRKCVVLKCPIKCLAVRVGGR